MNIALIGYGKMGKAIEEIAVLRGHTIALKIDIENLQHFTTENLQKCDVAIEFTGPDSAVNNVNACIQAGIPVVSGSTGWLDYWKEVENNCKSKNGSLLYASNFSIGVNIFFELNKKLARMMELQPDYDCSIEEIHHTQKKDAPSGTAITLAEQVIEYNTTKKRWTVINTGSPEEIFISSKRIDPAPGTHIVKYLSAIDDIEIIHTAHNRTGFATGAVLAAEFLQGKKGIFTMKEVLGL
jgi:4-hydroxy-tetrahydrodipicolinate reductase